MQMSAMRTMRSCQLSCEFDVPLWIHVDGLSAPSNLGEGRPGWILAAATRRVDSVQRSAWAHRGRSPAPCEALASF